MYVAVLFFVAAVNCVASAPPMMTEDMPQVDAPSPMLLPPKETAQSYWNNPEGDAGPSQVDTMDMPSKWRVSFFPQNS